MLNDKLLAIQSELKAPKNLYNKFGGYNYRNAEGILEAVKPLLKKYGATLVISDEIVEVGGRIYVKAIATLSDVDGTSDSMTNILAPRFAAEAYAREPETKKGMDDSQITGSTSSYARKYALNGLFLLDDNKDADTEEYHQQTNKPTPKKTTKKAPEPDAPAPFICERCGQPINGIGKHPASKVAEDSKRQFGLQMCYECAHAEKEARKSGMTTINGLPFPDEGAL